MNYTKKIRFNKISLEEKICICYLSHLGLCTNALMHGAIPSRKCSIKAPAKLYKDQPFKEVKNWVYYVPIIYPVPVDIS